MGVATALVYATLGRARIDYRFILLGAIAPDLVDGVLGFFLDYEGSGRGVAHSILAVVVVALVVLLLSKGERRLSLFGLAVGWLLHLVADGMWSAPLTFLWPAFGTEFAAEPPEPYSIDLVTDPVAHLATWGGELVGAALLLWFGIAFLRTPERRARFLRDGRFRA